MILHDNTYIIFTFSERCSYRGKSYDTTLKLGHSFLASPRNIPFRTPLQYGKTGTGKVEIQNKAMSDITLRYITSRYITLRYITSHHTTPHHSIPHHITLHDTTLHEHLNLVVWCNVIIRAAHNSMLCGAVCCVLCCRMSIRSSTPFIQASTCT